MCRNRVKSDIGEENNGRSGQHSHRLPAGPTLSQYRMPKETEPAQTKRRERMPIRWMHIKTSYNDHEENDREFQNHDRGVYAGALVDTLYQNRGDNQSNRNRGKIEPRAGQCEVTCAQIVIKWSVGKDFRQSKVEEAQEILKIVGPAVRHRGRSHGVLQDQIPAHDPRE